MGVDPISAGIGAVGSVAGAAISGKGAKKAAKIQAQMQAQNRQQLQNFYNEGVARYQGDIDTGNRARDLYSGLIGTGGNAAASQAAYETWRNSAGYKNQLNAAQEGIMANAYAGGMGRSGAAFKALQDRSAQVADNYLQTYLGNVNTQVNNGLIAKGALTGVGTTMVNGTVNANNAQSGAAANAALKTADAWAGAVSNLTKLGQDTFGSSYKK